MCTLAECARHQTSAQEIDTIMSALEIQECALLLRQVQGKAIILVFNAFYSTKWGNSLTGLKDSISEKCRGNEGLAAADSSCWSSLAKFAALSSAPPSQGSSSMLHKNDRHVEFMIFVVKLLMIQ